MPDFVPTSSQANDTARLATATILGFPRTYNGINGWDFPNYVLLASSEKKVEDSGGLCDVQKKEGEVRRYPRLRYIYTPNNVVPRGPAGNDFSEYLS